MNDEYKKLFDWYKKLGFSDEEAKKKADAAMTSLSRTQLNQTYVTQAKPTWERNPNVVTLLQKKQLEKFLQQKQDQANALTFGWTPHRNDIASEVGATDLTNNIVWSLAGEGVLRGVPYILSGALGRTNFGKALYINRALTEAAEATPNYVSTIREATPIVTEGSVLSPFFRRFSSKHLIDGNGDAMLAYTGKLHSILEIMNPDNTVNFLKLSLIINENADFWGGNRLLSRLENPEFHVTDPTTWDHTLNVINSSNVMKVPKGYSRAQASLASALHDAGKVFTGDGHGLFGATYFKLVFPDMDDEVYLAIALHMNETPSTPLGLFVLAADWDNGRLLFDLKPWKTDMSVFERPSRISAAELLGYPKSVRNLVRKLNPFGVSSEVDTYLINRSSTPFDFVFEDGNMVWMPGGSRAGDKGRLTSHFTTDQPVIGHMNGNWNAAPNTLLTPYSEVVRRNGFPINTSPMDTYFGLTLPFRINKEGIRLFTSDPFLLNRYRIMGINAETSLEAIDNFIKLRKLQLKLKLPKANFNEAVDARDLFEIGSDEYNKLQLEVLKLFDEIRLYDKDLIDLETTNDNIHRQWARKVVGTPTKETWNTMEKEIGLPEGSSGVFNNDYGVIYGNPNILYHSTPAAHSGDWVFDLLTPKDKMYSFFDMLDYNLRRGDNNLMLLLKFIQELAGKEDLQLGKYIQLVQEGINNGSLPKDLAQKLLRILNGERVYLYRHGGGIHIDPKNKGKFTETKKRTGKTTEELTHSKNPLTRKRAIFALNAKKWKH